MRVLAARNVSEAWPLAVRLVMEHGRQQESRGGPVLALDEPVTTVYSHPMERVLLCPVRDANPMFHLMESLWMLAGRRDTTWLDLFISDFSARFGERGGVSWGAYGYRWRNWFHVDQLHEIVKVLRHNPLDRRIVLGMWDAGQDLTKLGMKDYPCNTHAYFRIVGGSLDMTVCCRSNDIVWGCYGANAVHFSILQEYLASMIGVPVGIYRQVSNNYHAYTSTLPEVAPPLWELSVDYQVPLVSDPATFDAECARFVERPDEVAVFRNPFFTHVARPMHRAARLWRAGPEFRNEAVVVAGEIGDPQWKDATQGWMWRRLDAAKERSELVTGVS